MAKLRTNAKVTIESATSGKDAAGSPTSTFADRLTDVPCSMYPASSNVRAVQEQQGVSDVHRILSEVNLNPAPGERAMIKGVAWDILGYLPYDNPGFGTPVYEMTVGHRRRQGQ